MRLLLDTHLLLWALASPRRLSGKARELVMNEEVFVSAASIWEIGIKSAIGKLRADPTEVLAALDPAGFRELPVTGTHAAGVARLPAHHRDPFDRLLVSQALTEPMRLLTNDGILAAYGETVMVVG